MPKKARNIIIITFLLLLVVPFIMQTDLYPFMRFGMFSEPIKEEFQTERYIVLLDGRRVYDPKPDGIDQNVFLYLARNHYYRNESELFLNKLPLSLHYQYDSASLVRITKPLRKSSSEDSVTVVSIPYKKR